MWLFGWWKMRVPWQQVAQHRARPWPPPPEHAEATHCCCRLGPGRTDGSGKTMERKTRCSIGAAASFAFLLLSATHPGDLLQSTAALTHRDCLLFSRSSCSLLPSHRYLSLFLS